jgi:serine/threonine-protein kinase
MDANDENPNGDADDAALTPGTSFGAYTISRRIGKGGMGSVYESTHGTLGKRVAIKVLHPAVANRAQVRTRFLREAQAVSRLRHPHVVDASDFGVHEGVPFLVMELLDGETLAQRLAREGALSPELAAATLLPVCSAIAAAHAEGIIHRDLKPGNIFLARTRLGAEVPKVLDFGISKFIDDAQAPKGDLTNSSALLGTVWYMSPEQALDARAVTPASDQYALGVILYECVTGQRAFHGESFFVAMRAITDGVFVPPRSLRPTISAELEAVILRAMRRDPSERFASIDAFARALLAFATPAARASWEPVFTAEPAPPTELTERPAVSAHAPTEASSWERPEPSQEHPPEPVAPASRAVSVAFAPTAPATQRTSRRLVATLLALGTALALGLFVSSRLHTPAPVAPPPNTAPPMAHTAPPAPAPTVAAPVLSAALVPAPVIVDAGVANREPPRVRPALVRHPARTQALPRVARPAAERLLGTNGAPIED